MNRLLLGLSAGLALGLAIALGVRAGAAASPPPQEPAKEEGALLRLAFADRTPVWRTVNLEDKVPAMLVRAPEGQRFVLTDLWLLAHERLPVGVDEADRLWLECVSAGQRQVVFDQRVGELERPVRWQTGVAFGPGQEAWVAYTFADDQVKRPRRLHFSGYYEPVEPPLLDVRLAR